MANMVYDLVDPALLIDYVRTYNSEVLSNVFTLNRWLPDQNITDLEYRVRRGTITDVDVAEYRAWDVPAPMTGRPGVTRIRGEIMPLSRQIPLGEEEMLRLREIQTGSNDPIIQQVFDDSERMIRSVQARVELARGQVLQTGKFTLTGEGPGDGLFIDVDYGMPASNRPVAAVVWTNTATAKPLTDLMTWTQLAVDQGWTPGTIVMSRKRWANLYQNAEMRDSAADIRVPSRLNDADVRGILTEAGVAPIEFYDTKVRVNGVQTPVLGDDKVLLLPGPQDPMGNTFYGITAEAIKLRGRGYIDDTAMPGVVSVVTETDHPVQTFTVGTAIAMPVMHNPTNVICADVA